MAKSLTLAYVLWFFGGLLGLHLLYVRRDRHAFFTWATFGGVCGLGLIRDLFYIPTYVAAENQTDEYMEKLTEKMKKKNRPDMSNCRFFACGAFSAFLSILVYFGLYTQDLPHRYLNVVFILAHITAGLAVHYLANEGEIKVSLKWSSLGALAPIPLTILYGWDNLFYGSIGSTLAAWRAAEWRRTPRRSRGVCARVSWLALLGIIYLALMSSAIYHNAYITTKDGDYVPVRVAAQNFFKSPAWRETKEMLRGFYQFYQHHGWGMLWDQIIEALDPQGETNAYRILGLNASASQEEIKSVYKKLARTWHPDKVKEPEEKRKAEEKFMEIQEAYDILSSIKKGRSIKNKNL